MVAAGVRSQARCPTSSNGPGVVPQQGGGSTGAPRSTTPAVISPIIGSPEKFRGSRSSGDGPPCGPCRRLRGAVRPDRRDRYGSLAAAGLLLQRVDRLGRVGLRQVVRGR